MSPANSSASSSSTDLPTVGARSQMSRALNWRSSSLAVAGAELGLWMCLAFGLEVLGLEVGEKSDCYPGW